MSFMFSEMIMHKIIDALPTILKVLSYLIWGYGAFICWRQYYSTKRKSFLYFSIYCTYPFISLLCRNFIAIAPPSGNTMQRSAVVHVVVLSFPIMELILVYGLYHLLQEINKGKNENEVASADG